MNRIFAACGIALATYLPFAGAMSQEKAMNPPSLVIEHPSGEFATSLQAIEAAFVKLQSAPYAGRAATLSGQGQEGSGEQYRIADVGYLDGTFTFKTPVANIVGIAGSVGILPSRITVLDNGRRVSVESGTASELARFLDRVYREGFGIRPFHGERDYAFGAELDRSR